MEKRYKELEAIAGASRRDMKTIEFIKSDTCDWKDHYFPIVKNPEEDYSGFYVDHKVAERLLAALIEIESGLEYDITQGKAALDVARKAIKQAEEG